MTILSADPIGRKRVASLTAHDVEDALRRPAATGQGLREQGVARDSLVKVRGALRECLTWAESRERVARNVANLVKRLPTDARDAAEGKVMNATEARRFLAACSGTKWGALLVLCATLGLRPGEAAGLTWADVDGKRGTLYMSHTRRAARRDTPTLAPPKTAGSVRTLAAPPAVLAALAERRALQTAEAEAAGVWWANSLDLVFTNSIGGVTDPGRVRDEFARLAALAGLGGGWTPNHLRHTAASLMADAGVPMAAVADQLGHTTTRMLDAVYRPPWASPRIVEGC